MTGFDSTVPTPNEKGVWYKIYYSECPQCGRTQTERTRMHGPRPLRDEDRFEYDESWDGCD